MRISGAGLAAWCALALLLTDEAQAAKDSANKAQINRIHELSKGSGGSLAELATFLQDGDRSVRVEAVKAFIKIGGSGSLNPLVAAAKDSDGEVRIRATDGLVNFYLPGYVADRSLSGYLTRGVRQVKSFFSSRNDDVIDAGVAVRPDVESAIVNQINLGDDINPRANAALAAGVLRLKTAPPALVESLRTRDSDMIFESLIALQKIQDPSAGPGAAFLTRDLDERVQIAALETMGVLKNAESAPDVRYAVENARNTKVRRAALSALAMLAVPQDRDVFRRYVINGDPELRSAALEGLGRIREPEDTPTLQASYDEPDADWRIHLAAAFGLANEGNVSTAQFAPLRYLIETLNSNGRSGTAEAYLRELIRRDDARQAILKSVGGTTQAQKLSLIRVLTTSKSDDVTPVLTEWTKDPDVEVATAAQRALRILQTRRDS